MPPKDQTQIDQPKTTDKAPATTVLAAAAASSDPQIKIKDVIFSVPNRYAAGHVLTAVEASVLNQTFRENLRNNYNSHVEKAIEAAKTAGTALDEAAVKTAFAAYLTDYSFGERKASVVVDPIEKRAQQIARGQIENKIREKNQKVSDYKEKMDGYISSLLDKDPSIRIEAKRQIDAIKTTATASLDDILA